MANLNVAWLGAYIESTLTFDAYIHVFDIWRNDS